MIELERKSAPISRLNDCLVVDDNNQIFLLPSYSPRAKKKEKKRGKETVVHPFTPVSHDNSTRHFRNGQHFEQDRDRFSFYSILLSRGKIRGIVKIQGEYRFPPARFRKTASLRAFNREAFDVFLKRCQKRNRLNISILRPRGGEGDARQSSCQFFQRTNIRLDVFDKGWLIHPD